VFLNDFMDENTTAENISKRIYNNIRKYIGKEYKVIVEFPETENNIIQYGDLE
jgi:6-pyruvoyl-tetrahydropterin synthase